MASIHELLPQAMKEIGVVGKGQEFSGGQVRYNFRGIDDALSVCQPVFAKLGITPTAEIVHYESEDVTIGKYETPGYHVKLLMKVTFFAPDGSSESSVMAGEGLDTSDKATNKAMASAFKYALWYTLCVATKELGADDSDHESPQRSQQTESDARNLAQEWITATPSESVFSSPEFVELKNKYKSINPKASKDGFDSWASGVIGFDMSMPANWTPSRVVKLLEQLGG